MNKKIICIMAALSAAALFTNCGNKDFQGNNEDASIVSEIVDTTDTADSTKKIITTTEVLDIEKKSDISSYTSDASETSQSNSVAVSKNEESTASKNVSSSDSSAKATSEISSDNNKEKVQTIITYTTDDNQGDSQESSPSTVTEIDSAIDTNDQDNNIISANGIFEESDLIFTANGTDIKLDQDINSVRDGIGEPINIVSAPSCFYEGDDKSFIYECFTITTYPDGNEDYIVSIEITSDSISTPKGAKIGMTLDEVTEIYGSGYIFVNNQYRYQIDNKFLYFYIENGYVSTIGYVYANTI